MLASGDTFRLEDGSTLSCIATVRSLPHKRQVFLGELDGREVFAKLYLDPGKRQRHWQRELDGIAAFQQRGILTAELLYSGTVGDEKLPLIVLARLPEPVSLRAVWDGAGHAARERLLQDMVELLAAHHQAGLCQTDLHLDNFVISEGQIYSLDGAGVTMTEGGLSLKAGLNNLALFLAQLAPKWAASAHELYTHYLAQREIEQGPGSGYLSQQIKQAREWRWNKFKGKLFRECTAFRYKESSRRMEVVARRYAGQELDALLADPDASFPGKDKALKNGVTCTVWLAQAGDLTVVVKRYNSRGVVKEIMQKFLRGRALVSWENAHLLGFCGISTPSPVAVLMRKQGVFQSQSYFITEAVVEFESPKWFQDGVISQKETAAAFRVSRWFVDDAVPVVEKKAMAGKIADMLRQVEGLHISHGDMKAANILVVGGEPVLIDLDSMRRHTSGMLFRRAWRKDMRRFMSNWDDEPKVQAMFRDVLRAKGVGLVDEKVK